MVRWDLVVRGLSCTAHFLIIIPSTLLHSISKMANFYDAVGKNTKNILQLIKRVEKLEEAARGKGRTAPGVASEDYVEAQVQELIKKGQQLENDRRAIIAFNDANMRKDTPDRIKWTDTKILKGEKERTMSFTRADDKTSLMSLIRSDHRDLLCVSGPEPVNITRSIFKKYWVVVIHDKLVTMSRDFKGGIGWEYLWSSDEEMERFPPSIDWKNSDKRANDPRRKMIDPQTREPWKPEDEDYKNSIVEEDRTSSSSSSSLEVDKDNTEDQPKHKKVRADTEIL